MVPAQDDFESRDLPVSFFVWKAIGEYLNPQKCLLKILYTYQESLAAWNGPYSYRTKFLVQAGPEVITNNSFPLSTIETIR